MKVVNKQVPTIYVEVQSLKVGELFRYYPNTALDEVYMVVDSSRFTTTISDFPNIQTVVCLKTGSLYTSQKTSRVIPMMGQVEIWDK